MKKLMILLGLSFLSLNLAFADYELTLIYKNGVETKQCIKSYSFSNNLESLSRENGTAQEIYSEKETLTNKIFFGKRVYRKTFKTGAFSKTINIAYNIKELEDITNVFYSFKRLGESTGKNHWETSSSNLDVPYITRVSLRNGNIFISYSEDLPSIEKGYVILEYTKTTDIQNESSNQFKSYLHFVSSSSENDSVTTIDLKEAGVRFLEGFSYDSNTDSCLKN